MGWGFRKSIKIAPGVRVNLSKGGISTSFGGKGFTYNTRGRVSVSIPGTGIRFSKSINAGTGGRQDARLAGSTSIDPDGAVRLSKREQATRDFVLLLQERLTWALRQYFLSHGIYVDADDLAAAAALDEHQGFLEEIAADLEATTRAIRLAVDIGSISLAEKEKALSALYDIEAQCKLHAGVHSGIDDAAETLRGAISRWPESPKYFWPFVISVLGAFSIAFSPLIGTLALLMGVLSALFGQKSFEKRRTSSLLEIDSAYQQFSSSVVTMVSPGPEFQIPADRTRLRLMILGGIVLVIVGFALSTKNASNVVALGKGEDSTPAKLTSHALTKADKFQKTTGGNPASDHTSVQQPDFSWLAGKHPSEVLKDVRFKSAFNAVSSGEWKKIAERLNVSDINGIQFKDGYLVAEGCKAHFCDSDSAAFAINSATGKGVVVYRESNEGGGGAQRMRSFSWPGLSLTTTPLKAWLAANGASEPKSQTFNAPENSAWQKTSFDCANARSFAEKLICQDAELAQLDRELADEYAKTKLAARDQAALREHARQAWSYREYSCKDRECLIRWYIDEKVALKEFL